MTERTLRLFVSSPGDVAGERHRIDLVVERLNAEFAGRVRIETVRWERSYYSAHDTFQRQIPEAGQCDVVVAVFRGRLGTPLPPEFPPLPSGEPYPSGTAYEILSAIEVRRAGKRVPDVYVFRYPNAPQVGLDAPDRADVEAQWGRLKAFFDRWFQTQAGQFVAAFQTYLSTDDFAVKVEDCLRQWLAGRGFLPQGPVWDRVLHGSPFPGLVAFEADRGAVFFGREGAIAQAVARLREAEAPGRAPFLLLLGASGSGKSSLLRAGLLPRLVQPGAIPDVDHWRPAVMVPGADPFAALAEALFAETALGAELRAGTFRTREMLARQLAGDPAVALAPVRDALDRAAVQRQAEAGFEQPRPARLLLGVDQAERLFAEAPEAAAGWCALLAALVRQGLATAVMALRSDGYARLQGEPALLALRQDGATLDLLPPAAAELEAIVAGPVAACMPPLAFEQQDGRSLAARLVADARGGDALPLLQVSLARLYAAEAARGDGTLRFADYAGMDEAVTQTANDALATLDPAARAELPALVAGLLADVTAETGTGQMRPVVQALDRAAFERGSPARTALVELFVARRLLTAEGHGDHKLVRPVHEALLRIWPEAVAIVADTAGLIRVRRTLEPLVRAWGEADAEAKAAHLDLSPALLDGAQALLARLGADLPPAMRLFIEQAAAADAARRDRDRAEQERRIRDAEALAAARRRTARRTLAGLAVAVLFAALAGWQWRVAGQQRDRAQRSLTLATLTANGLTLDLATKFRDTVGVPQAVVKDILDRARNLQNQLMASGESTPALRQSQASALLALGLTMQTLGQVDAEYTFSQQAGDILQVLATRAPGNYAVERDLAISYAQRGDALTARGKLPEALASYEENLRRLQALDRAGPGNTRLQADVATAFGRVADIQLLQNDVTQALGSYKAALQRDDALLAADAGNIDVLRGREGFLEKIAQVEQSQGDLAASLEHFQASMRVAEQLAAQQPNSTEWLRNVALGQAEIGLLQRSQGKLPEALASLQSGLIARERLAATDAGNATWQRDVAISRGITGEVQTQLRDLPAALASVQAAFAIFDRLAKADPDDAGAQRDLSLCLDEIGDVKIALDDFTGALEAYQASLAIVQRLSQASPTNAEWKRDIALSMNRIARLHALEGRPDEALALFRQCRAIMAQLMEQAPANRQFPGDVAFFDRQIKDLGG